MLPEQVSFQEVKAAGKWVVTGEEDGVKQTICQISFANVIMDFFSRNATT